MITFLKTHYMILILPLIVLSLFYIMLSLVDELAKSDIRNRTVSGTITCYSSGTKILEKQSNDIYIGQSRYYIAGTIVNGDCIIVKDSQ